MPKAIQTVSVSPASADSGAGAIAAPENAESVEVLTVTVNAVQSAMGREAEQAGWTLVDSLSVGVLIMEVVVGLIAIGLVILVFIGYNSVREIRQESKKHAEESAEEKLRKFRDEELPRVINDAIRAHEEEMRRKETADATDKREVGEQE